MVPFLRTIPGALSDKKMKNFLYANEVQMDLPLQQFNWELFISKAKEFFKTNFIPFILLLSGGLAICHYSKVLSCIGEIFALNSNCPSKAPFTLRSIFGKARIKLVPVPLFWFLDYLFR
jgi:hypothetical protein